MRVLVLASVMLFTASVCAVGETVFIREAVFAVAGLWFPETTEIAANDYGPVYVQGKAHRCVMTVLPFQGRVTENSESKVEQFDFAKFPSTSTASIHTPARTDTYGGRGETYSFVELEVPDGAVCTGNPLTVGPDFKIDPNERVCKRTFSFSDETRKADKRLAALSKVIKLCNPWAAVDEQLRLLQPVPAAPLD